VGRDVSRDLLSTTLETLLASIADSGGHGGARAGVAIAITEADITVPLEATLARDADGRPILLAAPPTGTMKTGFDRPTRLARLHLVLEDDG
jgi:hypothetical protein